MWNSARLWEFELSPNLGQPHSALPHGLYRGQALQSLCLTWAIRPPPKSSIGLAFDDSLGDPGGPCPQDLFKIMQFSGNFDGKTPVVSTFWAQGPLGSKLGWAPLTKILNPPLWLPSLQGYISYFSVSLFTRFTASSGHSSWEAFWSLFGCESSSSLSGQLSSNTCGELLEVQHQQCPEVLALTHCHQDLGKLRLNQKPHQMCGYLQAQWSAGCCGNDLSKTFFLVTLKCWKMPNHTKHLKLSNNSVGQKKSSKYLTTKRHSQKDNASHKLPGLGAINFKWDIGQLMFLPSVWSRTGGDEDCTGHVYPNCGLPETVSLPSAFQCSFPKSST